MATKDRRAIRERLAFLEDQSRRICQRIERVDKAIASHTRQIEKHTLSLSKLRALREELVEVVKEIDRHI